MVLTAIAWFIVFVICCVMLFWLAATTDTIFFAFLGWACAVFAEVDFFIIIILLIKTLFFK